MRSLLLVAVSDQLSAFRGRGAALTVLGLALIGAYAFISCEMAAGVTVAERKPVERTPGELGLRYEDARFSPRGESITLRGWLIEGNRPQGVVIVHGLDDTRERGLDIAADLNALGYSVLVFDLRAHGLSEDATLSGGYYERRDALGAYDFVARLGIAPEGVAVLGISMGAAIALLASAEEPQIRAVIADSAFADVKDLVAQETARKTPFPNWLVPAFVPGMEVAAQARYGIDLDAIVPRDAAASLNYPVLLIHGDADERIPYEHSQRILAAARPGSALWLAPGAAHAKAHDVHRQEYIERVAEYLESRLGP